MPVFRKWAGTGLGLATASAPKMGSYLLDNRYLQSTRSTGVLYRLSPDMFDKSTKRADFGTVVQGVPYDEEWLKVGSHYLPMSVDGHPVLSKINDVNEDNPEAEQDGSDEDCIDSFSRFSREEEDTDHYYPAWMKGPVKQSKHSRNVRSPEPEFVQDFRTVRPAKAAVPGVWYEVVAERAVLRSQPYLSSLMENIKNSGEFVELFEWDEKKEWRRCTDSWQAGWMLIRHPQFGPLLQEVEGRLLPLATPMCEAIMQNDLLALRGWLKEKDKPILKRLVPSGLVMAAARGFHDCFVLLLETGLQSELVLNASPNSPGLREPTISRALARATAGLDFSVSDFDAALERLEGPQQNAVERLFERAARTARRQGESFSDEEPPRRASARGRQEPAAPRPHTSLAVVVARRVAVRVAPQANADIISEFRQGDRAELLDFDMSGEWRRVLGKDTESYGWTMLKHETLGQLWRLLDEKAKVEEEDEDGWNALFGGR